MNPLLVNWFSPAPGAANPSHVCECVCADVRTGDRGACMMGSKTDSCAVEGDSVELKIILKKSSNNI